MTATTTASQGSGPRYAPEDPTLPKPWKGLVDGSTGYLYYWNPVTNVTQYEKPVSQEQLPPPPPLPKLAPLSSVQVHQNHHDGDGRYRNHQNQGVRVSGERTGHGSADVGHGSSGTHSHAHGAVHSRTSTRIHGSSDVGVSLSAEAYRRQHEITVSGDDVPAPYMTFESTSFPPEILKEVQRAGFSSPTPIQAQSWPITLQKRDVVAIAKTGSGKTIGYLFPGFVHLKRLHNNSKMGPTVLVLSPTRELATQIQAEAEKFGRSSRISCTCLYGGAPKGPQLRDLDRGVDIVVATPGRLNDILDMRRISLRQVSYLVLDEADRMLDMGFEPQIRKIVKDVPHHRQTLMFTATWPKEVRKIAADLLLNPVQVNIGSIDELVANKAITQYIEMLKPAEKQRRLEQILRSQETGSKVLIFCSTKRMCDQLARTLARQFVAVAIHGDKSQGDRDRVLSQFKNGRSPILVATDVAARGLDIKDIRVVINYDFPTGVEDYVHRIGRTGRAGATGVSYTFFCDNDSKYAWDLVKVLEGADQRVPPELRDMVARGGYGGKSRRWGSGSGIRDRGRFGVGHGDSTNGGRSGRAISSLSRLDNGHDRNSYGRDRDARDRNIRLDGRSLDKIVHNDDKGILRGNEHSRSRSSSPSPRRGHGVLGSGQSQSKCLDNAHSRSRSRSRGRSRSRSIGRSNGRLVTARLAGKSSPPLKRKETSVDYHHNGESPPRKRKDTSDDRHHGALPLPKQELSSDRYRGASPSKREISNDRHRGPSSPKRDISIDYHKAPSPRSRSENMIDRHRRVSPSNLQSSHDDRGRKSLPKRDISIDRHRAPSPHSKSENLTDRHRRLSPPSNLQESGVDRGRTSPPKRDISIDHHRAPSPRSKGEIMTDRYHNASSPSKLQNSADDHARTSSVQKNESLIERECASTRDACRPISRDDSPSPPRQRSRSPYRERMENGSIRGLASPDPLSFPPSHNNTETEVDRPMYSGVIESEKFVPMMYNGIIESIPPMYQGIIESEKFLPPVYCGVVESGKLLERGVIQPTSATENREEDEEGLIPPDDEEGIILPDPENLAGSRDN